MAKTEESARRRGRPPVAAEKRKRHTLSFRLTDEVKAALQIKAEANGRSLSEEVESIVQSELFIDMNLHKKIDDEIESGLKDRYNRQIDAINECVIFQNVLSRLFRDLVNLSMSAKSLPIQSYIASYIELYDIVRYGIRDIEHVAVKERNELVMRVILDKLEAEDGSSKYTRDKIEKSFADKQAEMHNLLMDILRDKNITVDYNRPSDNK